MKKITPFRELPLSDKFMFGEVMRDKSICKLFLEELLQCKIADLAFITKEADLADAPFNHGIRLDVYLADENNTHYDVEMQNRVDALERRSRYYQSGIDRRILDKGADYEELPESYIIFICNFDYVGLGRAKYEKISYFKGTDTVYDDGSHVIFLNTRYREKESVSPAIAEYLDYIRYADDSAVFSTELAQKAKQLTNEVRNDYDKEVAYMTYAEYLRDTYKDGMKEGEAIGEARGIEIGEARGEARGIEIGEARGEARGIEKMIQRMLQSMPAEQVAAIVQKPVAEIQAIANRSKTAES